MCYACDEDQPNQMAHMEPGGCMYYPKMDDIEVETLRELGDYVLHLADAEYVMTQYQRNQLTQLMRRVEEVVKNHA